jgi:hypothetical protein
MIREYTNAVLEAVEEGVLDRDAVILACLKYMSEDDVKDMVRCNDFLPWLEDDEEVEEAEDD